MRSDCFSDIRRRMSGALWHWVEVKRNTQESGRRMAMWSMRSVPIVSIRNAHADIMKHSAYIIRLIGSW